MYHKISNRQYKQIYAAISEAIKTAILNESIDDISEEEYIDGNDVYIFNRNAHSLKTLKEMLSARIKDLYRNGGGKVTTDGYTKQDLMNLAQTFYKRRAKLADFWKDLRSRGLDDGKDHPCGHWFGTHKNIVNHDYINYVFGDNPEECTIHEFLLYY